MRSLSIYFMAILICGAFTFSTAIAQTTEFTFQGSLKDSAILANGNYDFEFALFDALSVGNQLGSTVTRNDVPVANGIFSVKLDFGSVFPGADRYLEIRARLAGQPSFTLLAPRQLVNSAPYSVKSLNTDTATTAGNALQLGGVAANQYVVTTDPRMTDARNPLPNSANYIWNQNSVLQPSSNFVISGNGDAGGTLSANVIRAETQYNIGGNRVLSVAGTENVFAGVGAGTANTGTSNSFFGRNAGQSNTAGDNNSFFGRNAGQNSAEGDSNSFFGANAGQANMTGGSNSFFGRDAGFSNTAGIANSYFGINAGRQNMTGNYNSFFGHDAGRTNTGLANSFFGAGAGRFSTTGGSNSFFGRDAGENNTEGGSNSFFGSDAGRENLTGGSNSFFGRSAGRNNTEGSANSFFGINTGDSNSTGNNNSFFGSNAGDSNTSGDDNAFFGSDAGRANTQGFSNSFFGHSAGEFTTGLAYANSFFGRGAGSSNTTGNNNTIIGDSADVGSGTLTYATAIGAGVIVSTSNTIVIGRFLDDVRVPGNLIVSSLGAGGATALCRNASQLISTCSSSIRYKENINQFDSGLDIIRKLRPISFNWKDGGMKDVGFGAEDVERIDSRFVTYNGKGEVEGVKYDRLSIAFVNAIKEQQAQIEVQKKMIESQQNALQSQQKEFAAQKAANQRLQSQMDDLKKVVCTLKPDVEICK